MRTPKTKLRVRREEGTATLTFKGPKTGIARREFEYEIPCEDADLLLSECGERIIEKTRHCVEHLGTTWAVDVYHGIMEGVVIAEIELPSPDHEFPLPDWVGREVTHDLGYKKLNLLKKAMRRNRRKSTKPIRS